MLSLNLNDVSDFEMLCSLGLFNANLMNDAIFKFKRYEDSSLTYTGLDKHENDSVGGWDTVLKKEEYEQLFYNQQATMELSVLEQPETITKETEVIGNATKSTTPKSNFVTSQYGIKPTASMKTNVPIKHIVNKDTLKENEADIDLSTAVSGAKVIHKIFGEGEILNTDKKQKYVYVKFAAGQKSFIFPDSFYNGYLKLK